MSTYYNNNSFSSYNVQRRERRFEARNRQSSSCKLWNESDSEVESADNICKNFIKIKKFFSMEKVNRNEYDYPESESEHSERSSDTIRNIEEMYKEEKSETSSQTGNIKNSQNEFLSRKRREEEVNTMFEENEDNLEIYDEDSVGPQPMKIKIDEKDEQRIYARSGLRKDEAELYAQFVQQGKRIPRRGEVGLSSEEINKYESLGYVMSGTRHRRMNLMRMKKEQQLYTAEEKRALAIYNLEEQQRRERNIINEMKYMWQTKKDESDEEEEINQNAQNKNDDEKENDQTK